MEKVVTFESKTKSKDKNTNSLETTNAWLSIRNAIGEANVKYMQLQDNFNLMKEERNGYHTSTHEATSEACKADMTKQDFPQANFAKIMP